MLRDCLFHYCFAMHVITCPRQYTTLELVVDHCSISRIFAIRKLLLSTRLFFRSEMKQGSAFGVFLHSHARSVSIGNALPC
jgi:hypothetical protein